MPIIKYESGDPEVADLRKLITKSGWSLKRLSQTMGKTAAFWSRKLGPANRQRRAVTAADIAAARAILAGRTKA